MSSELDPILQEANHANSPWRHRKAPDGITPVIEFEPDTPLLAELLGVPVRDGAATQSGRVAKALDAWVAHEFRRAGFDPDSVWPRASDPRVLPGDIKKLIDALPATEANLIENRILNYRQIAPRDARFLGRAYLKQVDVAISDWSTGPELLISTKAMTASFGKNLSNRFEEAYGDAGNLRSRYPAAAVGFLFMLHASVLTKEPQAFQRAVDMLRKLRDDGNGNGYTATGLILAGWDPGDPTNGVTIIDADRPGFNDPLPENNVPADLSAGQFFSTLVHQILDSTPVNYHEEARRRHAGK